MANTNYEIIEVLKTIAPGTPIREGLENILKAKTGGLIVIGDGKEVMDIADGGFYLDVDLNLSAVHQKICNGTKLYKDDNASIYLVIERYDSTFIQILDKSDNTIIEKVPYNIEGLEEVQ